MYEWVDGGGIIVLIDVIYILIIVGIYIVIVMYFFCDEEIYIIEISIIEFLILDFGVDELICDGGFFEIILIIIGDIIGIIYLWSIGEIMLMIIVNIFGNYDFEIIVGFCVVLDIIVISIVENFDIELGEDF